MDKELRVKDSVCLRLTDLAHDGDGVGRRDDGLVVFVPGGLPQEDVEVRLDQVKAGFARATLLRRKSEAHDRIDPRCPVAQLCGGCGLQHLAYSAQLQWKTDYVRQTLARLGRAEDVEVRDMIGMDDPYRYRNKAQYKVGKNRNGQISFGFYQRRSHDIVSHDECFIVHPVISQSADVIRRAIDELRIADIKEVEIRVSFAQETAVVKLVAKTKEIRHLEELVQRLRWEAPHVQGVVQSVGSENKRTSRLVWGQEMLVERIGKMDFEISPDSFFQVNPEQTVRLYETVLQFTPDDKAGLTAWDLFCGTGTIGLYVMRHRWGMNLRGLDSSFAAIADARRNANRNGLHHNASFETGRAEHIVSRWLHSGGKPDLCIVDPPRSGCHPELLRWLSEAKPDRIIYISCNPATLARDVRQLALEGYRPEVVQPVDMFPQTPHIESVTLLRRNRGT